jgi:hypothetical protein
VSEMCGLHEKLTQLNQEVMEKLGLRRKSEVLGLGRGVEARG